MGKSHLWNSSKYQHIQFKHDSMPAYFPLSLCSVEVCRIDLAANELLQMQDSPEVKRGADREGKRNEIMLTKLTKVSTWNIPLWSRSIILIIKIGRENWIQTDLRIFTDPTHWSHVQCELCEFCVKTRRQSLSVVVPFSGDKQNGEKNCSLVYLTVEGFPWKTWEGLKSIEKWWKTGH